jgi:hypothetical protein
METLATLCAAFSVLAAGNMRERVVAERVVVEYEPGALAPGEARAFAALASQGVVDVEGVVAAGLPAWVPRTERVRFVVSARADMSSARGRTVVLPLERVRSRSAPYLHESVHALVPSRGDAAWLSEGLASYVESWVAENRGGYDAHVFSRGGNPGIDVEARRALQRPDGRAVLPWVGGEGEPPRLFEDRAGVARPFYVLAQSFAKFIAERAGVASLVRATVSGEQEAIRNATGRGVAEWRQDWLRGLVG